MSIVGLFAPYVIGIIQKRHYKEIELKGDLSIANTLFKTVKIIGQVAIFAILGFIFFWIPVINFIFFYIAFYYMFDKMLILDVGAEINTKEELEQILKKNRFRIKKHSFGLYLLNNIPVIGILFQIYTIIYMSHFYMIETKRVRNV
jgi:hypothetical protein